MKEQINVWLQGLEGNWNSVKRSIEKYADVGAHYRPAHSLLRGEGSAERALLSGIGTERAETDIYKALISSYLNQSDLRFSPHCRVVADISLLLPENVASASPFLPVHCWLRCGCLWCDGDKV